MALTVDLPLFNKSCIYTITSEHDETLVYIGQTINYNIRYKAHINAFKNNRHGNKHLQRVYNKYNNLRITPFEICNKSILNEREIFWIDFYKTYENNKGYNLTKGGTNAKLNLLPKSKESRKKQSDFLKANPVMKGKTHTESWHIKMQESILKRKKEGTLKHNSSKSCICINLLTNEEYKYDDIKQLSKTHGIAYTYVIEKLIKDEGVTFIKNFKIIKK